MTARGGLAVVVGLGIVDLGLVRVDLAADPVEDVERYNRLLEAQVRLVPDQYLWVHRRFKGLSPDYPDYYGRDSRRRAPIQASKSSV